MRSFMMCGTGFCQKMYVLLSSWAEETGEMLSGAWQQEIQAPMC